MKIILKQNRLSLEKNLDISVYANPKFDWKQMKNIREQIEQKIKLHIVNNF